MEYDEKDIKTEKKIINGQEVEVKIIPAGMHGKDWKPNPYDSSFNEEEDQEIQMIKKDLVEVGDNELIEDEEEPVISSYNIEE